MLKIANFQRIISELVSQLIKTIIQVNYRDNCGLDDEPVEPEERIHRPAVADHHADVSEVRKFFFNNSCHLLFKKKCKIHNLIENDRQIC